eukprot:GFYU01003292.1.p1 GENE.GFYU01003292.1~~GFYU01003292.1.p1  ORF type:complete len:300 (-),score=51.13 GFYU01003292.1:314-1213(-)
MSGVNLRGSTLRVGRTISDDEHDEEAADEHQRLLRSVGSTSGKAKRSVKFNRYARVRVSFSPKPWGNHPTVPDLDCTLCGHRLNDPVSASCCNATLCKSCYDDSVAKHVPCPLCKKPLDEVKQATPNLTFSGLLRRKSGFEEILQTPKNLLRTRGKQALGSGGLKRKGETRNNGVRLGEMAQRRHSFEGASGIMVSVSPGSLEEGKDPRSEGDSDEDITVDIPVTIIEDSEGEGARPTHHARGKGKKILETIRAAKRKARLRRALDIGPCKALFSVLLILWMVTFLVFFAFSGHMGDGH